MYKTSGFRWLHEAFCPASAFVTADKDDTRNPQRFIPVTVIVHCQKTETYDRMTKEYLLHKGKKKKVNRTVKHIWFLPTHKANNEKPKELALFHRTQTE